MAEAPMRWMRVGPPSATTVSERTRR